MVNMTSALEVMRVKGQGYRSKLKVKVEGRVSIQSH